ncbi:MAG TPA: hypothetical protein VF228_00180 [Iamia sp.]
MPPDSTRPIAPIRRRPLRRRILASLLVLAAVTAASAAVAVWSGSGAGTGAGATGSTVAITLSAGTPTAGLRPGGAEDVVVSATNPNPSPVFVGSLVLDTDQGAGGFSVDAGHATCGVSALSFGPQTNGGEGWTVPARIGAVDGTLTITTTDALAMDVDADAACQGASFTVWLESGP